MADVFTSRQRTLQHRWQVPRSIHSTAAQGYAAGLCTSAKLYSRAWAQCGHGMRPQPRTISFSGAENNLPQFLHTNSKTMDTAMIY